MGCINRLCKIFDESCNIQRNKTSLLLCPQRAAQAVNLNHRSITIVTGSFLSQTFSLFLHGSHKQAYTGGSNSISKGVKHCRRFMPPGVRSHPVPMRQQKMPHRKHRTNPVILVWEWREEAAGTCPPALGAH